MGKCYEIIPMRVLIKNSYHCNSICGNQFLVRKIRGIGPIPREEYSSRDSRPNPHTNISSQGIKNSRGIFLSRNNIARFIANPHIFLVRILVL